jgi:hypothetical protein
MIVLLIFPAVLHAKLDITSKQMVYADQNTNVSRQLAKLVSRLRAERERITVRVARMDIFLTRMIACNVQLVATNVLNLMIIHLMKVFALQLKYKH